jgi:hypothetical protein
MSFCVHCGLAAHETPTECDTSFYKQSDCIEVLEIPWTPRLKWLFGVHEVPTTKVRFDPNRTQPMKAYP